MKNTLSQIFFILALLHSCEINAANDFYSDKKLRDIQKLMFIYNIDNIDFESKERADTLFHAAGIFNNEISRHLAYVTNGECSICIAALMDFLATWKNGKELPIPTILVKGTDAELVKFYVTQEYGDSHNFNIITISPDVHAQDGAYFIVNHRILGYTTWNINP